LKSFLFWQVIITLNAFVNKYFLFFLRGRFSFEFILLGFEALMPEGKPKTDHKLRKLTLITWIFDR